MKLNILVPNNSQVTALYQPWQVAVGGTEIGEVAELVDRLGFARLTVGEHFAIPADHVALSGAHHVQAVPALAYVAGRTKRIRLASNISQVSLQHPIVQAKQWAVLDWLSEGRADLMVGSGWCEGEFDALGVDFASRGRRLDEYIEAILGIWSNELFSYHGEFVQFDEVASAPKPVQPGGVPLWFAGDVPATIRRVAKWGAGWSPFLTPPERIPEGIDRITSHPDYHGQAVQVFFTLSVLRLDEGHVGKEDLHDFDTWDVQKMVDQLSWVKSLGVTEAGMPTPNVESYQQYLERLHWLAEEIIPRVRVRAAVRDTPAAACPTPTFTPRPRRSRRTPMGTRG